MRRIILIIGVFFLIVSSSVHAQSNFAIYKQQDKYYLSLPDSLLGRDLLILNRVNRAGADLSRSGNGAVSFKTGNCDGGNFGARVNQQMVRFRVGTDHKIFLCIPGLTDHSADSTSNGLYQAVWNSNMPTIAKAFSIVGYTNGVYQIDITDWINSDDGLLYLGSDGKSHMKIGGVIPELTSIDRIVNASGGIDLKSTRTYSKADGGSATMELLTSFLVLSKTPLKPRYADPRVGFFTQQRLDYDINPQGVDQVSMITRWRMEPRPEDLEKYKRGELVKPAKPIVFYIDPATPKKWVPYFIQGVKDWQSAFEKAGFKDAIVGKVAPSKTEDPNFSITSSRYSAIIFHADAGTNGGYSTVIDPRSGEILESHVNFGPNQMKEMKKWFFAQSSPSDERGRMLVYDDRLMGQLLRWLVSHEVGHALGFPHNQGASSAVPVEKLRDKNWLEVNGLTPSIMDYSRCNYVAQPEDHVSMNGLISRVGDYDRWAIEWGYRYFPESMTVKQEKDKLRQMILDKMKDRKYWYGGENNEYDPRVQGEDIGNDAMLAGGYGIKNLKRVGTYLVELYKTTDVVEMNELYAEFNKQYGRYLDAAVRNIGGIYNDPTKTLQSDTVYTYVPKQIQEQALAFLNEQLFQTPLWLLDASNPNWPWTRRVKELFVNQYALFGVLSGVKLNNLVNAEIEGKESLTVDELFNHLRKDVWTELYSGQTVDRYRANLQQIYLQAAKSLLTGESLPLTKLLMRKELIRLLADITTALSKSTDDKTTAHLQDCKEKITEILNPKLAAQ